MARTGETDIVCVTSIHAHRPLWMSSGLSCCFWGKGEREGQGAILQKQGQGRGSPWFWLISQSWFCNIQTPDQNYSRKSRPDNYCSMRLMTIWDSEKGEVYLACPNNNLNSSCTPRCMYVCMLPTPDPEVRVLALDMFANVLQSRRLGLWASLSNWG